MELDVNKTALITVTFSALAAGAVGLAGATAAFPSDGSAADTAKGLQDKGFNVRLNGTVSGALSKCIVTGVQGLNNSNIGADGAVIDPSQRTTVFVDISCPPQQ
jgi:hypothetical protein